MIERGIPCPATDLSWPVRACFLCHNDGGSTDGGDGVDPGDHRDRVCPREGCDDTGVRRPSSVKRDQCPASRRYRLTSYSFRVAFFFSSFIQKTSHFLRLLITIFYDRTITTGNLIFSARNLGCLFENN